jgi:hypothetical protein
VKGLREIARVKYDVRGVEGKTLLPAGVYNAKVASADVTKPEGKDERIELVLEVVGDKTHKGAKLYEYINLESESAKWKLREFLEAVGLVGNGKKEAGTLDTSKILGTVIGVKTFVRAADDARGFDEQSRVRRMFASDSSNGAEAEAEDLDDDNEDESDYSEMDLAELKAELKERGLSTKGKRPALITRLEEADEEDEDEDEDDDTEGEGEEYEWDDIAELSRAELKELIVEEELDIKTPKKKDDDAIRAEVAEALDIEVPDADDEDEDDDDYDEWDIDDLKEELGQRSLSQKGSKKLLVSRLRKDDAEEDKPF